MKTQNGSNCLLVYPRFTSESFWNYRATCDLVDARYPAAPLGLITVAAMLPQSWNIRLIDCNAETLRDEDIEWADFVLSGGMISQQKEHLDLIERIKPFKKCHIVGGPDATSSPHLYARADHLVLGEAEVCLPEFLLDLQKGEARHVYDPEKLQADVTKTPVPRFDLLSFDNYLHVGIQYARGCPFNCEFCDIIELFGRVPRVKEPDQILAELQTLYDLGYRGHVDLVDDNFIGNRAKVRKLLPKMKTWLEERKFPFEFTTEATINLADDEKLMQMMKEVGFWAIFVGIESPDEETLKSTQKGQNTKRSIPESIQKIYRYGMMVNAGYIVGFDAERGSVARGVIDNIEETAIPVNMVGLLFALPNTQLARRLAKEGRLIENFDTAPDKVTDQCNSVGFNFETKRPKRDILKDYREIIRTSYSPEAYFNRVLSVASVLDCSEKRLRIPLRNHIRDLRGFGRLIRSMGVMSPYRHIFWKTFVSVLIRNPKAIRYAVGLMALYLHFGPFKEFVLENIERELGATSEDVAPSTHVPLSGGYGERAPATAVAGPN